MRNSIILTVFVLICGCTTERLAEQIQPFEVDTQHEVERDEIHKSVLDFQSIVGNEHRTKTSTTMTIEETIWSQEALANYEYAQNYFDGVDLAVDTLMYSIYCYQDSVGDFVCNIQDVINTYSILADSLSQLDTSLRYQYIDLVGAVNPSNNSAMITALAFKTPPLVIAPDVIVSYDQYQAGQMLGHCNKLWPGDVRWRIEKHLNWNMKNGFTLNSFGSTYPQGNFYFTSVKHLNYSQIITSNPPDEILMTLGMPLDPYDHLSPALGGAYSANFCIPADRIQFYSDAVFTVLSHFNAPGWEPIGVQIEEFIIGSGTPWNPYPTIYHRFKRGDYGIVTVFSP